MKTVRRTVFKGYYAVYCNKEGRSCSPLLEMAVAISHLLLRFMRICALLISAFSRGAGREFRALRSATKGSASGLRELGSARPADVGGVAA
ncbi:MAG: hypothetical protein HDT21_08655 [Ruminococcus sp.]|nr:hypothetical protein [Ruminococcus sp.]